jgi:hypothetical protein
MKRLALAAMTPAARQVATQAHAKPAEKMVGAMVTVLGTTPHRSASCKKVASSAGENFQGIWHAVG